MSSPRPSLIVPVENLARELDAKLLLACVAAERGYVVTLGSRTRVDFRVHRLARGLYLAKSMTPKTAKMFENLRLLGHEIAVLDEEALVYHSPEHFYARRLSPETLSRVSALLAWGQDSADLLRKYPGYADTPIAAVGHPRVDLLRPELRAYFDGRVRALRERYGKFLLVNTNFGMVNGYLDSLNVFRAGTAADGGPALGAAGVGATPGFARGYAEHKSVLFEDFKDLLAPLSRAFPEHSIVVRPHPGEKPEPWHEAARAHPGVRVAHEGNVVPWLMAADALVHNGCTTAVEAALLGIPAIAYRPVKAWPFDLELPNSLSHEAGSMDALVVLLGEIVRGERGCVSQADLLRPLGEYLTSLDGKLASDRIVDHLEEMRADRIAPPRPPARSLVRGWMRVTGRALVKQHIKARIPEHRNTPAFQAHRFGGISLPELRARISRLASTLGRFEGLRADRVVDHVFRISR